MTNANEFDEGTIVPPASLDDVKALAQEASDLDRVIEEMEDLLSAKKGRANALKTKLLPDAMAEVGLTDFTLDDGSAVKVDDFVAGSLPKEEEKRTKAIALLESSGGADLIKNEISASFGKSQHNIALDLASRLKKEGFDVVIQSTVHPQTLLAFVREKMRGGDEVDYETLGVFAGRKATIKAPKVKKAK